MKIQLALRGYSCGFARHCDARGSCPRYPAPTRAASSFWVPGQFGSLAAVPQTPGWSLGAVYIIRAWLPQALPPQHERFRSADSLDGQCQFDVHLNAPRISCSWPRHIPSQHRCSEVSWPWCTGVFGRNAPPSTAH